MYDHTQVVTDENPLPSSETIEKNAKLRASTCWVTHVCLIWHQKCVYFDTNYFSSFTINYSTRFRRPSRLVFVEWFTCCDLFQYCRGVKFNLKLFRRLEVNCKRGLSSSNISWKDVFLDFVILNFRLVSTIQLVLLNTTWINIFIFRLGISG